jgi:hypothetical protein
MSKNLSGVPLNLSVTKGTSPFETGTISPSELNSIDLCVITSYY